MKKTLLALFAAAALFGTSAQAADMMQKHKLECAACHVDGVGKPVPADQCRTCHDPKKFEQHYMLKNGKANPHVSIHYLPETVDCTLCHREHSQSVNYCSACHADGLGFKVP